MCAAAASHDRSYQAAGGENLMDLPERPVTPVHDEEPTGVW
ncbi:MAG: hypothetical protein KatS3mg081_2643 [Gemmatimonadales bacterium]|nr:hypothetical protein HRbin33_01651 [bacterium HR33]GIW53288.1 MAG: hypothetical protein KatS3mg081_2643 [Gemmatimonadales bacterium]